MKTIDLKIYIFFTLIISSVLVMFAAVIVTPSLSFDDLLLAKAIPQYLATDGWAKTAWRFLTMSDVGQSEMRTYGLTRVIQLFTVPIFGASPAHTMGFVIIVHAASGLLVYRLLVRTLRDHITSALLAIAWVASPAVLPTVRTEHHWLYLIAPYYALIGWVILNETRFRSKLRFFFGGLLLTSVWYMGEAPIMALVLVCALWTLSSPTWKSAIYVGGQAIISVALLGAYLAYQLAFINKPHGPHRFVLREISSDRFGYFFSQLWENAKGILGLPYIEADLGMTIPSFQVADKWQVWALFAFLLLMWLLTLRFETFRSRLTLSISLTGTIWLMWIGSVSIYFLLTLFQATAFPLRYSTAFFLFTPIAIVLGISALSRDLLLSRTAAAIVASFAVAFSTALTLRYEFSINEPDRILLSEMKDLGLIAYHHKTPGFVKGVVPGPTYPGVIPITSPGYGDPIKSFWTLSPMLALYAGTAVGSECRFTQDGKVEIRQGENVLGIRSRDRVRIVGTEKHLEEICDAP